MAGNKKRNSTNKNSHVKYNLHESRNGKRVAKSRARFCLSTRILNNKKNGTGPR